MYVEKEYLALLMVFLPVIVVAGHKIWRELDAYWEEKADRYIKSKTEEPND